MEGKNCSGEIRRNNAETGEFLGLISLLAATLKEKEEKCARYGRTKGG